MNRRDFLQSVGIVSVILAFAKSGRLFSQVTHKPGITGHHLRRIAPKVSEPRLGSSLKMCANGRPLITYASSSRHIVDIV
jgi:hypothetical protein